VARSSEKPARPGPRDGSRLLFSTLGGVVVGLIVYILKLGIAPAAPPENVLFFVAGGAVLGLLWAFLLGRKDRSRAPRI
jgi:hypothetical protein